MSDVPAYQDENGIWRNEYGEEVAPPGDPNQTATILEPNGHAGAWDDGHGGQNYGAEGEIALFGYESTDSDGTDANASVLGVKGEAYVGDHGFGIGAQANISEGTFSEQQFDPNEQGESHVTGGVSWGLGAGASGTWDVDSDGDGYPESSLQVEVGPVTLGVAWEDGPTFDGGGGTEGAGSSAGESGAGGAPPQ